MASKAQRRIYHPPSTSEIPFIYTGFTNYLYTVCRILYTNTIIVVAILLSCVRGSILNPLKNE